CGMKMAAEKAGHMSAPDDAPKEALKIPLAQGAVTHVALFGMRSDLSLSRLSSAHADGLGRAE
ncbi:hypothetical protein, partial [Paenirhodobacter populi]|uniref:hypothetical protein n=1 Tax=Paenirhodobacter populi TaxID=2306993 RepID=UPI0019D47492